jgi:hypothetical protein
VKKGYQLLQLGLSIPLGNIGKIGKMAGDRLW